MPNEPKREISTERKALYYTGMGCIGLGFLLFVSVFFSMNGPGDLHSHESFRQEADMAMGRSFGGMILMGIGSGMMWIGRHGLAGSGVLLDPKQARKDLEPWNRAAGGMANDAINEIDLAKTLAKKLDEPEPEPAEPIVKVRCGKCKSLNDEHAKFCNQCGTAL
jgi:hypothetical protein